MNQSQQYEGQSPREIQEINHKGDTQFFSRDSCACRHATSPLCRPRLRGSAANWQSKAVAEPPKLYDPHAPIIVPKTYDGYACTPDNLRRSVGCPRRTLIQLRLTAHTRINKGVTTTL
jgi:hypothetical protein